MPSAPDASKPAAPPPNRKWAAIAFVAMGIAGFGACVLGPSSVSPPAREVGGVAVERVVRPATLAEVDALLVHHDGGISSDAEVVEGTLVIDLSALSAAERATATGAIAREPATEPDPAESSIRAQLHARSDYLRPEDQTFLTIPEWYIVYSADELGAHLADRPQSTFPFFASIKQFWDLYDAVSGSTKGRWPFNTGYHVMIGVIGVSYTVEFVVKGLYEGTVGRFTEWVSGDGWKTNAQDRFYGRVAKDYGDFIHHTPWYAYPFGDERRAVWQADNERMSLRGIERSVAVWSEMAAKSAWGGAMGWASGTAYGEETGVIQAWVRMDADQPLPEGIAVLEELAPGQQLLSMPRYEPFSAAVPELSRRGVEFVEIAGGDTIIVQVIAPETWTRGPLWGDVLIAWPILTEPGRQRVAIEVPVPRLDEVVPALDQEGVEIEHVYDY